MSKLDETNIGQCLCDEREKQGLSIDQVAKDLCLSETVIQALENNNYDALPELVFTKGYIDAYCKLLKIPYLERTAEPEDVTDTVNDESVSIEDERVHRLISIWGSLFVGTITLILIGIWWLNQNIQVVEDASHSATSELYTPDKEAGKNPAANGDMVFSPDTGLVATEQERDKPITVTSIEPDTKEDIDEQDNLQEVVSNEVEDILVRLTIQTNESCWTSITDGHGDELVKHLLPKDYEKTFFAYLPIKFIIGKASVMNIWINDNPYDLSKHKISSTDTTRFRITKLP